MAIDWSNEDFARLYKRDTDDDLLLSWQAEAVWHKFLKRCDKSGIIETRRGVRGLAALLRIPVDVIEAALQELLEDGRIRSLPAKGFIAPNYVTANYVARSAAARQARSRLHKRIDGQHGAGGESVDDGLRARDQESESHDVTGCHDESQFSQSTNQSNQPNSAPRRGRSAIPSDWQPRERERAMAAELGLNCEQEAREFLTYWQGDGRAKADWDQTFAARLQTQARMRRPKQKDQEEVRDVRDM